MCDEARRNAQLLHYFLMAMQLQIRKACSKLCSPNNPNSISMDAQRAPVRENAIVIAGDCHNHKDYVLINSSERGLPISLTIINQVFVCH